MAGLYIHIGTEKTGTSSIQKTMSSNEELLLEKGFHYPKTVQYKTNHVLLAVLSAPEDIRTLEIRNRLESSNFYIESKKEEFLEKFAAELIQFKDKNIVLSSEHLSSRLSVHTQIQNLKDLIEAPGINFDFVKIVLYLRRQEELLPSYYSTAIKTGNHKEFDINANLDYWFDYKELVSRWAKCFGEENIEVRIFDKKNLVNANVIDDFCELIKLDPEKLNRSFDSENRALSAVKLAYLKNFNKNFADMKLKLKALSINGITGLLERMPDFHLNSRRINLGANKGRKVFEMFKESNDFVAQKYLGKSMLFEEMSSEEYGEEILPQINAEDAFFIHTYLWVKSKQIQNRSK